MNPTLVIVPCKCANAGRGTFIPAAWPHLSQESVSVALSGQSSQCEAGGLETHKFSLGRLCEESDPGGSGTLLAFLLETVPKQGA